MTSLRRVVHRLASVVRFDRAERELEREVISHLALLQDEYQRRGMSAEQARIAARRALGGVDQTKERHRDERSLPWLEDARRDVPYALRAFRRNPGFTLAAVLTIALGVGATSAIFSVVNAILLRPLPYKDSDRLVRIAENVTLPGPQGARPARRIMMTQDEFVEWRTRLTTISHLAAVSGMPMASMSTPEGVVRVTAARVSPMLFDMLGVRPLIGRALLAEDERPGVNVAVLSESAWARFFGSDPSALGRSVVLNNTVYSIVGVMPAGFDVPSRDIQMWMPFAVQPGQGRAAFGGHYALLKENVSIAVATQEVDAIGPDIRRDGQRAGYGVPPPPPPPAGATMGGPADRSPAQATNAPRFEVVGVKDALVSTVRPALGVLALAAGVVLLIVCANVANLLLARSTARQREIGVRLALGASRGRIVRQILTESTVLSLVGGIGGIVLAVAGVHLVKTLATADTPFLFQLSANLTDGSMLPRLDEIAVDGQVLAFTFGASLLTGLFFGLAPAAYLIRVNYARAIGAGAWSRSSGGQPGRARVRNVLVVAQLVMATTLLMGAGLLVHSFVKLLNVNTGYDARNVLNLQLVFPEGASGTLRLSLVEEFLSRVKSRPGVQAAGFTNIPPFLALTEYGGLFVPPGVPREQMLEDPLRPQSRAVSHDYLPTLGVRLLEGRWLNDADAAGQPNVMLVNRALADRYFGGRSPVGVLVNVFRSTEQPETWEIVGVVDNVSQARLDQDPFPLMYMDVRQMAARPGRMGNPLFGIASIAVRTSGDWTAVAMDARAIMRELDPSAGVDGIATLEHLMSGSLVRPRFYAVLVGILACIAGILAAVGIYGVLAYAVVQRTQEIGIRMALGAERRTLLVFVLRQGLVLTLIGLALGLGGALALTRYLEGMLYGLTPLDAPTYALVAIAFATVAALASYVPARRATKVDPVVALRCE